MASRLLPDELDAWRALMYAHAAITGRVEQALEEAGLPPLSWYDVLWALHQAPGQRLRMAELADHTVYSRSGLTRLVDRMEDAGVLQREAAPGDRRGAFAVLTESGDTLLREMWPAYDRVLREDFAAMLKPGEAGVLRAALRRVHRSARAGTRAPALP